MTIFIHSGNYGKKLNAPIKISKKKLKHNFIFIFTLVCYPFLQIFYMYPYYEQSIFYAYVYFLHTIKYYYILLHQTSQIQIFNFIYYCTSQFFYHSNYNPHSIFFSSHKCIIFYYFIFQPCFSANVIPPYEHQNFQCIISVWFV